MVVLADNAPGVEILGHLLDDIPELKFVGEVCRDSAAAKKGSHDVAADGSSGIAVSGMVDGANDGILEGIPVLGGAVDGDGQCFMASPTTSNGLDGVVVFDIGISQIQCLGDKPFLFPNLLRPEFTVFLVLIHL